MLKHLLPRRIDKRDRLHTIRQGLRVALGGQLRPDGFQLVNASLQLSEYGPEFVAAKFGRVIVNQILSALG